MVRTLIIRVINAAIVVHVRPEAETTAAEYAHETGIWSHSTILHIIRSHCSCDKYRAPNSIAMRHVYLNSFRIDTANILTIIKRVLDKGKSRIYEKNNLKNESIPIKYVRAQKTWMDPQLAWIHENNKNNRQEYHVVGKERLQI